MAGRSQTPAVIEPPGLLDVMERPQDLLKLPRESFDHLVQEFVSQGAPFMAALKRGSGILAWAARHKLPDTHYGAWLHRFADEIGVSDDSVIRWRDRAITELGLPMAAVQADRSRARLAGARKAQATVAPATPGARAAAEVLAPAVIGSAVAPPARDLVERLMELSAEDLADSASTEELHSLKDLIDAALAEQRRIALRARLVQSDRKKSAKAG